jgi:FxsC-like protein
MPPLFFFSYARDDSANSDKVKKFFDELLQEVRKRGGFGADAGFIHATDIKTGDPWPESLAQALRLAKVFVCLTTPTYVQKEFCGKELQAFLERWQSYRATLQNPLAHPSALLPVVWIPLRGTIPEPLASYQLHDNSLPEEYRQEGLEYLMRLNTKRDQYEEFLIRFADKIIAAVNENALPELQSLRAFDAIQSALHATAPGAGPASVQEGAGPKSARFIFVAATRSQMANVRQQLEAYDGQGGFYWQPFHPEEETVGYFAMEAALQQRIQYNELPFGQDLLQRLDRAHQENSMVLVLLDAWALRIEPYRSWMRAYDRVGLPNCALLVAWNDGDVETLAERRILEDHLRVILPAKFLSKPSLFFRDAISSAEELRQTLRDTLTQIQMKILEVGEAKKRIEAAASAPLPLLPVPGARIE